MESQLFASVLRKVNVPTPLTEEFESALDENGNRRYGQQKNRWWDNSTGNQKEHLICWFSRKHYEGSTSECIENNLGCVCKLCYFTQIDNKPEVGIEHEAEKVFGRMKRPEMFIYIAEALQILNKSKLEDYITETKQAMDKGKSWMDIRKKYINWEQIEVKAIEILQGEIEC